MGCMIFFNSAGYRETQTIRTTSVYEQGTI